MIDSLKDLERDIETFHNNILASNELNDLLQGVIGQARSSAELFEKSSNEMLAKLDVLPDSIGKSVGRQNQMQEEILREDVNAAISTAVAGFTGAQEGYLDSLQKVRDDQTLFLARAEELPQEFSRLNRSHAEEVQREVNEGFQSHLAALKEEQDRYLKAVNSADADLTATRETVKSVTDRFIEKAEAYPAQIEEKNNALREQLQGDVNEDISRAVAAFREEQAGYMAELKAVEDKLTATGRELEEKYSYLVDKMDEIRASGLLDLKADFDKRMGSQNLIIIVMGLLAIIATLSRFFI